MPWLAVCLIQKYGSMTPSYPPMTRCLAFDTSTDVMSVALTDGVQVWQHTGPGGAMASTTLIPAVMALLAEAGLTLDALDAIAFGQGPGSFTGLRTACAVAQGLAFGAGKGQGVPVLPIPTLWALAEEARFQLAAQGVAAPCVTALLDARMDEMYVLRVDTLTDADAGQPGGGVQMIRPENLVVGAGDVLVGNVFSVYAQRLPDLAGLRCVNALPTASAMLRLAPALAARGHCVPADQALPLYVRNKVAQTTVERAQVKADKLAAAAMAAV